MGLAGDAAVATMWRRCGELQADATMSQDDINNGRLICEIDIAPGRPAEFVVIRIFQNTAESQR